MADAHDGTANFFNAPSFVARRHYREGRQKWEVLYQPQGSSAPSLAARKGIAGHYGVGQPNQALFPFVSDNLFRVIHPGGNGYNNSHCICSLDA